MTKTKSQKARAAQARARALAAQRAGAAPKAPSARNSRALQAPPRRPRCNHAGATYCHLLCDPFEAPSVGVPAFPSIRSEALRVFVKSTLSTGSGTWGFVLVRPEAMIANDYDSVFYSDAFYASNVTATSGTGVLATQSNSPYSAADFDGAAGSNKYRLVACGLRVKYVGTNLDRGGTMVGLTEPDHDTLNGHTKVQFQAYDNVSSLSPVADRWYTTRWFPVDAAEMAYQAPIPAAGVINACMAFLISAPSGSTYGVYDFEVVAHFEIVGPAARHKASRMVDPMVQTVAAAASSYPESVVSTEKLLRHSASYLDAATSFISSSANLIGTSAAAAATLAGAGYVGQRLIRDTL